MLRPSPVRTLLFGALVAALVTCPALAAAGPRGGATLPRRFVSRAEQHRPFGAWLLSVIPLWPAKPGLIIDPDGAAVPREPGSIIDPSGAESGCEPANPNCSGG